MSKRYKIVQSCSVDNRDYKNGEVVELDDDQAAALGPFAETLGGAKDKQVKGGKAKKKSSKKD